MLLQNEQVFAGPFIGKRRAMDFFAYGKKMMASANPNRLDLHYRK